MNKKKRRLEKLSIAAKLPEAAAQCQQVKHMRPQKGPRITLIFTDLRRFLERKISVNLRNLWT
ncbi:MAG: hypothetical protein LBG10_09985, partial [Treponema sp.]|nr:hypothetical protein [Treponema sp.]